MSDALTDRVLTALRQAFEQPELAYDADRNLRTIPTFDSVLFVQMILGLEAEFGLQLREDEVDSICTMGDVQGLLGRKMAEAEG